MATVDIHRHQGWSKTYHFCVSDVKHICACFSADFEDYMEHRARSRSTKFPFRKFSKAIFPIVRDEICFHHCLSQNQHYIMYQSVLHIYTKNLSELMLNIFAPDPSSTAVHQAKYVGAQKFSFASTLLNQCQRKRPKMLPNSVTLLTHV